MATSDMSINWVIYSLLAYMSMYLLLMPIHVRIIQTTSRIALRYRLLNDIMNKYALKGNRIDLLSNI